MADEFEDSDLPQTMKNALEFVNRPASDLKGYKRKDLGLQLSLFALAEQQVRRIASLSGMVIDLEKVVFDPDVLRELDPGKAIGLYKMGTEALREAYTYVQGVQKSMNWNDIGDQLTQMAIDDSVGDNNTEGETDINKIAAQLLSQLQTSRNSG